MDRTCDCGSTFEAKRSTARYCSERCKKRAQRSGRAKQATVTALPTPPPAEPVEPGDETGLVAAVRNELVAAKRLDTALGQTALALARRLERADGVDTGSAVASMSRELRATLAEAVRGAHAAKSTLQAYRDELAARRQQQA